MKAELVAAIAESVSAVATIALVIIAARQLREIARQIRIQGERERKWATVRACDRYSSDPLLYEVSRRVWEASVNGTDYSNTDRVDKHDVIVLMNYFEVLAIGVKQGLYLEAIVKDFHEPIMDKVVKIFLKGEHGPGWVAGEPYFHANQFSVLRSLHDEWSSHASRPGYHDEL